MTDAAEDVTRVVGAAVLDSATEPTRVLAAQRSYPESLRGLWEFPGGKQEPGESARDALLRECREELHVELELLDEVRAPQPQGWPLAGAAVMRVFAAVPALGADTGLSAGEDHLAVRWLPLADPAAVLSLPWIPADLPIVAALLELLRSRVTP